VSALPSAADNPNGLHQRYIVTKADGAEVDPKAVYFVLRIDNYGHDVEHVLACRKAALAYADRVEEYQSHLTQVGQELRALINDMNYGS
jgi:hypothetical protein